MGSDGDVVRRQAFLSYALSVTRDNERAADFDEVDLGVGCSAAAFFRVYRRKMMLKTLFEGGAERDAIVKLATSFDGLFRARITPITNRSTTRFDDAAFTKRMRSDPHCNSIGLIGLRLREAEKRKKLARSQSDGVCLSVGVQSGCQGGRKDEDLHRAESAPVQFYQVCSGLDVMSIDEGDWWSC